MNAFPLPLAMRTPFVTNARVFIVGKVPRRTNPAIDRFAMQRRESNLSLMMKLKRKLMMKLLEYNLF